MRRLLPVFWGGLAVLIAVPAAGTTYHVPGDFATIQLGLDACEEGDTVLVAAGEYHENLFWPFQNGIVLIGAGMDSTVVIGDQIGTVLYMALAEIDTTTVVKGLCIRNGGEAGIALGGASPLIESCAAESTRDGPGIFCVQSQATIRANHVVDSYGRAGIVAEDCSDSLSIAANTISGNNGLFYGGGIYCDRCSPSIMGNTIIGNTANRGGGISCYHSSPTISGNTIRGNWASRGGGIECRYSSPTIQNNILTGNGANDGGGIYCKDFSSPIMYGNEVTGNTAVAGGGIYSYSDSLTVAANNIIVGNTAEHGGGICCYEGYLAIQGSTIAGNDATLGGGVYFSGDILTITGSGIIRNEVLDTGGGIFLDNGMAGISLSTLTENTAWFFGDCIFTFGSPLAVTSCNLAYNGWALQNTDPATIPVIQNNWWGHQSGPWHDGLNPTGQGDSRTPDLPLRLGQRDAVGSLLG